MARSGTGMDSIAATPRVVKPVGGRTVGYKAGRVGEVCEWL